MDSLVVGTTTNRAEAIEALHRWGPTTFVNGEDVWYFTNLHSRGSAAEALVITNARIIALHPRSGAGFRAMHAELASVHAEDTRGRVRVVTAHGFTYTFKGLTTADVAAVSHYLDYGRQRRPDQAVTAQIVAQVTAPRPTPATPLPVDQPLPPPARPEVVESEPPGTSVPAHHIQMAAPQIAAALLRASAEQAVLYGRNVDVVKAEVVLSKWARAELLPGEFLWLFVKCKSSRPTADVLVITNARIIALDSSLGITFMVAHSQSGKPHADLASSRLTLMTATGWWLTAKSMDTDDISAVIFCVEHAHEHPAPYQVRVGAEDATERLRQVRNPTASEKRIGKAQAKQQRVQQSTDRKAADLDAYGKCLYNGVFGLRTVRIYEHGFVRVGVPMFSRAAAHEKLIAIQASADVGKKSGFGRAVGAAATAGLSLASSNKRGDVYVTITTDANTYVLHEDPPNVFNMKQAKKIEGIGLSVIHRAQQLGDSGSHTRAPTETQSATAVATEAPTVNDQPTGPSGDLASRLKRLNELLADGLVTEDEYAAHRARLLEEL